MSINDPRKRDPPASGEPSTGWLDRELDSIGANVKELDGTMKILLRAAELEDVNEAAASFLRDIHNLLGPCKHGPEIDERDCWRRAGLRAALRDERLAVVEEIRAGYHGDKSHWFWQWLDTLLDEVGVAGLTGERNDD